MQIIELRIGFNSFHCIELTLNHCELKLSIQFVNKILQKIVINHEFFCFQIRLDLENAKLASKTKNFEMTSQKITVGHAKKNSPQSGAFLRKTLSFWKFEDTVNSIDFELNCYSCQRIELD